tara:strand:+ start:378 stop:1817 length:1440 start_codon:yes stop_codon:yes gene_type:complete
MLIMKFSKKFISLFFSGISFYLLLNFPGIASGRIFDRVVAKVNNEIITLSKVQERVEILKQKSKNKSIVVNEQKLLKDAIEMMIAEKLQLQEGKKIGFEIEDSAVEEAFKNIEKNNGLQEGQLESMLESEGKSIESYKNHIRDQILVSKITRFELGSRIKVGDRNIQKYYYENQKEFWKDSKYKVRHILIMSDKNSPPEKKKESYKLINKVLSDINNGKDFALAAKEYSEDVSANSGGLVGYIEKGQMVSEFEEAVFGLKEGEISGVIETEFGFHVIKVDEIQPGRTLTLTETKDTIYKILSVEKQKLAYEDWMKELKESAFIEVLLFEDVKINKKAQKNNLIKQNKYEKANSSIEKVKRDKIKDDFGNREKKEILEKRWVEMYKSVQKSKHRTSGKSISAFQTLEEKLAVIKKLRSQEKISEVEYQERKQKLLEITGKSISSFQTLEEKLKTIRELRLEKIITEEEYQEKKQQLLDGG